MIRINELFVRLQSGMVHAFVNMMGLYIHRWAHIWDGLSVSKYGGLKQ